MNTQKEITEDSNLPIYGVNENLIPYVQWVTGLLTVKYGITDINNVSVAEEIVKFISLNKFKTIKVFLFNDLYNDSKNKKKLDDWIYGADKNFEYTIDTSSDYSKELNILLLRNGCINGETVFIKLS